MTERSSEQDRYQRELLRWIGRHEVSWPRMVIAVLLPIAVAFYSVPIGSLLAIPCAFIVWRQLREFGK